MKKKLLAILTTLTMIFIIPVSAFAGTYQCSLDCQDAEGATISGSPTTTSDIAFEDGKFVVTAPTIDGYLPKDTTKEFAATDWLNKTNPTLEDTVYFVYGVSVKYTVKYQDKDGKDLSDPIVKEGFLNGPVQETALDIDGYRLVSDKTLGIDILDENPDNNLITFVYEKAESVKYTVSYVDENGSKIIDDKEKTGYVGETVVEKAEKIDGYKVKDEAEIEFTLSENEEDNNIQFVYTSAVSDGPKTGDAGLVMYVILAIASFVGAGFGIKKKFF